MECVRRLRKRLGRRFWRSPIRRQRPAWNRPKSPPNSKANYGEAFFDGIDPERPSSFKKWLQIRSPARGWRRQRFMTGERWRRYQSECTLLCIRATSFLIDGEPVIARDDGMSDFRPLRKAARARLTRPLTARA
jgi:hypothetical protein